MKKILLLIVTGVLAIALFASDVSAPSLFDINKELDQFEIVSVKEEEKDNLESLEFYLVTGGPGSMIWENFGHSAILMIGPNTYPLAFDWGIFTFDDSFFLNFAFGRLYYEAWATYGDYRIESLIENDRDVTILKLQLDNEQKKNLSRFLAYSTKEENRTYLYDYFRDNCATRPRDIFSWLTGGDFEETLKTIPAQETLRETVERHLSLSSFPVCWAISYLLGPDTDKNETMWEACFLPSQLNKSIEEYQNTKAFEYYTSLSRTPVPEKWNIKVRALIMGIIISSMSLLFLINKRWVERIGDITLGVLYMIFAILSLVLLFLMLFTIHNVTKGNMNYLIISPLCLVSSILHFSSLGKKRRNKEIHINSFVMLSLCLITLVLRLMIPSLIQDSFSVFIPAIMLYLTETIVSFTIGKRENQG